MTEQTSTPPAGSSDAAGGGELEPGGLPVTVWLALAALAAAGIYVAVTKLGATRNLEAEAASIIT